MLKTHQIQAVNSYLKRHEIGMIDFKCSSDLSFEFKLMYKKALFVIGNSNQDLKFRR